MGTRDLYIITMYGVGILDRQPIQGENGRWSVARSDTVLMSTDGHSWPWLVAVRAEDATQTAPRAARLPRPAVSSPLTKGPYLPLPGSLTHARPSRDTRTAPRLRPDSAGRRPCHRPCAVDWVRARGLSASVRASAAPKGGFHECQGPRNTRPVVCTVGPPGRMWRRTIPGVHSTLSQLPEIPTETNHEVPD